MTSFLSRQRKSIFLVPGWFLLPKGQEISDSSKSDFYNLRFRRKIALRRFEPQSKCFLGIGECFLFRITRTGTPGKIREECRPTPAVFIVLQYKPQVHDIYMLLILIKLKWRTQQEMMWGIKVLNFFLVTLHSAFARFWGSLARDPSRQRTLKHQFPELPEDTNSCRTSTTAWLFKNPFNSSSRAWSPWAGIWKKR